MQHSLAQDGFTYSDLLEAVRREKAIALLKNSKLNLTDIAHQLGYSNPANFSRAFNPDQDAIAVFGIRTRLNL